MFNTFNGDHHDLAFGKKQKALMKERLIELNNFSTIQLNPWNDDHSKSPLYEDSQVFPNFPKPNIKNTAIIKYTAPRLQAKKHQNKIVFDRKRNDPKNWAKKQSPLIQGRKKFISDSSELQKMNKTVSVNNFEGEKMFARNESIQRRQKVLEREEKRHKTTINNPMYGRFCINYNSDKQNLPQRKKIISDGATAKFDNITIKEIMNFRSKMSTLSMDRGGDPERAKSIHEVRRRLKSTSEIMRRKDQSLQIGAHEITQRTDKQLFCQKPQPDKMNTRIESKIEYVNMTHVKNVSSLIEGQRLQSCESGEKFKLGKRKNLYIGFRKFFNLGLNLKQKPIQRKQSFPRDIVNLDALMEQGQGDVIRKFEKFQEYAFQKSLQRNLN